MNRGYRLPTILTLLMLLAACSQSVRLKVAADIPEPAISTLPLTMGIYYDDQFRHYTYTEESKERPNWRIETGDSQVAIFDRIFSSLFAQLIRLEQPPGERGAAAVDAVLSPSLDDIQFALPNETMTDHFEAWVRYTLTLYSPAGDVIATLPVTGYGRTQAAAFAANETGLNSAINLALRDAGARLIVGFRESKSVSAWLAAKSGECQSYARIC